MWQQRPQRPPPTYEDVRRVAEVLSRINTGLIERHFAISADTAKEIMERLVGEKLFGEQQADGWHYPPVRKLRLKRTRRKSKITGDFEINENFADQPKSMEDLIQRIDEQDRECYTLRAQVKRLQNAGKTVIAQREEWKARALAAEETAAALAGQLSNRSHDDRFDALRRLIARELHPDFGTGGEIEKAVRTEFFKRVWSQIEDIAGRRTE